MARQVYHHPNKELYPDWVILLKNDLFHRVLTVVQRMNPTAENLMFIRGLADSLEYEYLMKRRELDIADKIGEES